MPDAPRPPLITCIGGGGSYALGFGMGFIEGMLDEGIQLRRWPMIGTSGGSHVAAAVGAGLSFETVGDQWEAFVDSTTSRFWTSAIDLAEPLYGPFGADEIAGVAVRMLTFRRKLLWSGEHRLADIVAASSSPLPFARPHKIDGKRYIDGGHRSTASADLVPDADLQILLAPFSDRRQGLLGWVGARQARKETVKWSKRTSARALWIGPSDEMVAIKVSGMKDLGDMAIGRRIQALAVPLGRTAARTIKDDFPEVAERLAA